MARVQLIHWNEEEAKARIENLSSAGFTVIYAQFNQEMLRVLKQKPPCAVVIDLSRLPSQGRDLGISLRMTKATRFIPLVFVDGKEEKITRVKSLLPDAVYTTWEAIPQDLAEVIANPPDEPIVPPSTFAAYSKTPLPKKLGITEGVNVALVAAPAGFEHTLGTLPTDVVLKRGSQSEAEVTLWFNRSSEELRAGIHEMGKLSENNRLWIIWPKKASGVKSDLTQTVVRKIGLDSGLVDFKICALDKIWSGLCFTTRKK